ncbi:MAG: cupin domain-containing protein [Caldilineaceae bacterium]
MEHTKKRVASHDLGYYSVGKMKVVVGESAMAKSGSIIYNKISTDKIIFTQTRDETNGSLLEFENYHQTHGIGPVPHRHPLQEETFLVRHGTLAITVNGKETIVTAGEQIVVPANALHHWRNTGNDELHMQTTFRPALHFEEIIETIACLSQVGKMDQQGNPDPIQMSATLNAYYGEFFLGTMPMGVQQLLFGFFGAILRRVFKFKSHLQFADLKLPEREELVKPQT